MFNAGISYIGADGGKLKVFIIKSGSLVFDVEFGDNEVNAGLFEFAVWQAVCPEKLGSSHFKPYWINSMVNDAGLVCFTISWDDDNRMPVNCNFFGKSHIFFSAGKVSRKQRFCKPGG